jgi:hypothetical protein
MIQSSQVYLQGEIVEEQVEFTLTKLCRVSGASAEEMRL